MKRLSTIPFLALAIALGAATYAVQGRLARPREQPYDILFVPPSATVRWLSLGHPLLAGDVNWLRAVQYIGEPRADARGWDKLYPLADLITDLDPRHGYVYQVAGDILATYGRVEESNRLLEKGIRNVPDRYILPFQRAVNAMLYQGDYQEAGRFFEKAASTPGAPEHLRENVVAMYVKGNAADAAIAFLKQRLAGAQDDPSRKALEQQLLQARLEQAAMQIDEAVDRYRQRMLVPPVTLVQLVAAGDLAAIPPDPFGGSWVLDADGRAHSTVNPRRFQRPMTEAERAGALHELEARTRSPR